MTSRPPCWCPLHNRILITLYYLVNQHTRPVLCLLYFLGLSENALLLFLNSLPLLDIEVVFWLTCLSAQDNLWSYANAGKRRVQVYSCASFIIGSLVWKRVSKIGFQMGLISYNFDGTSPPKPCTHTKPRSYSRLFLCSLTKTSWYLVLEYVITQRFAALVWYPGYIDEQLLPV